MAISNLFGWQLDSGLLLDNSLSLDDDDGLITIVSEVTIDPIGLRNLYREDLEVIIESIITIDDVGVPNIDLLPLIPEKFRTSQILIDYADVAGQEKGFQIGKTDDLQLLVDPDFVDVNYIVYLANNLGYKLTVDDNTTEESLRKQLSEIIDFYKIKGTYESLLILSYMNNLDINIWDLWTNDYITFVMEPWFVGNTFVGNVPNGLSTDYYKSAHFLYELKLETLYDEGSNEYLYSGSQLDIVKSFIYKTIPINTVPHYGVNLICITNVDGILFITDYNVKTVVTADWQTDQRYLDESPVWELDTGINLDTGSAAFLSNITKYKLGIGNKGISPDESGFALQTIVKEGNITNKTEFGDRFEFEICITDTSTYTGLSELGLFLNDNTTMVVASIFPDIDKNIDLELRILVKVFK
jgi:hypothetical protein